MRILGPSTLISAATSVADGVADMVVDLPGTVNDVIGMIGRAGDLLDRAEALLTKAEAMVDRGEKTFASVESMLDDGEAMLDRAAGVLADSEKAMTGATGTLLASNELLREASGTLERGDAMMAPLEDLSSRAMPHANAFMDHLDQTETAALIGMVDRLPRLLTHLDEDILPMLGKLDQVGPDVHEILDAVHDMTSALSGLPGAGFLKRRGERKEVDGEGLAYPHGHPGEQGHLGGPTY